MNEYIARRTDDGRTQSLLSHINAVAVRAKQNASSFDAGELAYACGIAHDIGKYSAAFQSRITKKT